MKTEIKRNLVSQERLDLLDMKREEAEYSLYDLLELLVKLKLSKTYSWTWAQKSDFLIKHWVLL